jgi:catechol 2,3-dioxygenase-like lactoylglutathione lyase family enzyme
MVEITGIAHFHLTVSEWERCRAFYEKLLPFLGMKLVFSGEDHIYYIGGRTAVGIGRCNPEHAGQRFVQGGVGMHHLCFRARNREDIDAIHDFLKAHDATIVRAPEGGPWAPGYYSVLFEDPSGIRLEVNHIPGKGVLEEGQSFNPAGDYR